jgi:BirA family biotin operon repressor/biotin-[acetyl-CoA-carboxylase] ligase
MTTTDKVFLILRGASGYLSGEKISQMLGLSRSGVNNCVQQLRQEGFHILSATNRGYRLQEDTDLLSPRELLWYLGEARMESVYCYDSIDSTNEDLKRRLADSPADGTVAVSNQQTRGKGRMGRTFISPKDVGIYLSMILRTEASVEQIPELTAWTAVAVSRAIKTTCGATCAIKWVNDLLLNGKKICGILTEAVMEAESGRTSSVVIGIGINANESRKDFPEEIRDKASSLSLESGRPVCRAKLTAALIKELDRLRKDWPNRPEEYLRDYRMACITLGKNILVEKDGSRQAAEALAVNDDFSLKIRYLDTGETASLRSGEARIRAENGEYI